MRFLRFLFNEAPAETGEGSAGIHLGQDGNGPNVTFIGGRAVEQHDSASSDLPEDDREKAKRAVREALNKAKAEEDPKFSKSKAESKIEKAKEVAKKAVEAVKDDTDSDEQESNTVLTDASGPKQSRGSDGKFVSGDKNSKEQTRPKVPETSGASGDTDSSTEDIDVEKSSLKQILKNREKIANAKKEFQTEYQRQQLEIQRQREEFQRQQAQFAQEQAELHRQREQLQRLRSDPGAAIRELGHDPEQFIMDLASEGTPEGQLRRERQQLQREIAEIKQWRENQAQQAETWRQQQIQEHYKNQRNQVVNEFLNLSRNDEKYPLTSALYAGNERALVAFGDLVGEDFRQLTGRNGTLAEILDYIEDSLAEKANAWYTKRSKTTPVQKVKTGAVEPKSPKGKSLSPEATGERRALVGKDLSELDGEERYQVARQAVRNAIANAAKDED